MIPFGVLLLAFALTLALSLVRAVWLLRRSPSTALAPLAVLGVTVIVLGSGVPLNLLMRAEFRWRAPGRHQVLEMIDRQQLAADPKRQPMEVMTLTLPAGYRHLSWDHGRIWVYQREGARHVVFPTTVGMFLEFTGYVHRTDGREPLPPEHYLHGSSFRSTIPLGGGWYHVATFS